MDARQYYEAGQLQEAVQAALQAVKQEPGNTSQRSLLCELLCFAGELERADKQLETILLQQPSAGVGVTVWRALIRGEIARRQFYTEGRLPEFVGEPSAEDEAWLRVAVLARAGDLAAAGELAETTLSQVAELRGVCDGQSFAGFRDWDDLLPTTFELLTTSGKYYWIPMSRVRSIEFHPLAALRDLIWRPARISVEHGPDGEVYFPVRYHGADQHTDEQIRLARATDWSDLGGLTRGVGVRMFMVGDESRQILQINHLRFES